MALQVDYLVIHGSDTPASMDIGREEIYDWHVNGNGWSDVGYNLIIRRDGTKETGRDLDGDGNWEEEVGAHARGFNSCSIGICLIGGNGQFNYTQAQMDTLRVELTRLKEKSPSAKVVGHNELDSSKQCPCFDVKAWWYG